MVTTAADYVSHLLVENILRVNLIVEVKNVRSMRRAVRYFGHSLLSRTCLQKTTSTEKVFIVRGIAMMCALLLECLEKDVHKDCLQPSRQKCRVALL